MPFKTPSFWYSTKSASAYALSVATPFYALGRFLHTRVIKPYKPKIPVICAGNLVAGGSGKTPVALALLQIIRDEKLADAPCFLTRGYGRKTKGHFLVNKESHDTSHVGDEALLLVEKAPTIVAGSRKDGAKYAEENEFDLIIMDDGMQNPGLHKDINFTVIDGATGFGNELLIPAGPLRETKKEGFSRTDAFIIIGEDKSDAAQSLPTNSVIFQAEIKVPDSWIANKEIPYIAFCGLGQPQKFKNSLTEKGLNITEFREFPDHHEYTTEEIKNLLKDAKAKNARLITTAKDAVRIPAEIEDKALIDVLPIEICWKNPDAVAEFIREQLSNKGVPA